MSRESVAYAVSGVMFGLILGWMIGTQRGAPAAPAAAPAAPAQGAASPAAPDAPAEFDAARATELERQAKAQPSNAEVRVDLGNVYFDGKRYPQAIEWYTAALTLQPKDVNASTDLAVALYYNGQTDEALAQFEKSLGIDPKHLKTLLNQGIVRAWGKGDLVGAQRSWEQVVAIAPQSEEGRRAKQGLEGITAAHQAGGAPTPGSAGSSQP